MVKKLLLFVLVIMLIITSCTWSSESSLLSKEKRNISKIEKKFNKYKGYTCKANIKFYSGEKNSEYLIEEKYTTPDKYKLEILEPKESKGIIILNTEDKIFIEHPSINQSISLVSIKSLNKQMLIGDFLENISDAKMLSSEEIEEEKYLVFEFKLKEKNKYRNSGKIWIKDKKYTPYKLNIFDENGSLQVEIIYEKFKFTKIDIF